jgi:hypothetical protein
LELLLIYAPLVDKKSEENEKRSACVKPEQYIHSLITLFLFINKAYNNSIYIYTLIIFTTEKPFAIGDQ